MVEQQFYIQTLTKQEERFRGKETFVDLQQENARCTVNPVCQFSSESQTLTFDHALFSPIVSCAVLFFFLP